MKKKVKYLKKQNVPLIGLFIIWCTAIYLVHLSPYKSFWFEIQKRFSELSGKDGLFVAIVPILNLLLTGLLSSQLKAKLVFWRVKYALPGHRVFTKLAPKDVRIDMNAVKSKFGNIPTSPKEQNTLWYKYFKKYEAIVTIENSHKNFLLARDLSIIALLFSVIGTIGLIIAKVSNKKIIIYFIVMLFQYILLAIVAQNHGNRLACNVLAETTTNN